MIVAAGNREAIQKTAESANVHSAHIHCDVRPDGLFFRGAASGSALNPVTTIRGDFSHERQTEVGAIYEFDEAHFIALADPSFEELCVTG